jgi:hypothetical protein
MPHVLHNPPPPPTCAEVPRSQGRESGAEIGPACSRTQRVLCLLVFGRRTGAVGQLGTWAFESQRDIA